MAACNSACATSRLPVRTAATTPIATRSGWWSATKIRFRSRRRDEARAACSDRAAASTSAFEETDMTTTSTANTGSTIVSGTTTVPTSSTSNSSASPANALASQQIAGNFQSFLQLLTTQLQNQNPLSPLDTNQFTQQ